MQCPRCQHENSPHAKFCEECAAPLARTCPNCGAQTSPGAKFCSACAHPLTEASPIQPRFATPEAYTPKHLAEKILTSKAALEGERKQVTVLFADLKGSMELLADRDPEEARKLLDPVLELMMEAVHRYEGTVNQVMGDGIMALFGAPLAHEDHAVRACYAALRMQESVKRYGEDVQRSHGITVQVRVGLNSGDVVVRAIGSDLHMDYTAVGQTTHLAARMEQMAAPGSVLMTADSLKLAEGFVQVKPLGAMPVKGRGEPAVVYELVGLGPARTRLQASAARGLIRLVGRSAEMEQLRRSLEKADAGHGQMVAVVGEAGVGKSRLAYELTHSPSARGWLVLESDSTSYGKTTPYLPVVDLLRTYFQIESDDDARKIREKVTGKLLSLDRALEPSLPALLWLLDVGVEDGQWDRLDPPQRRQRTLEAIKRLILRESQAQPLLLVFEDVHWIDSETQAFLDSLLDSLPAARIVLVVNYRPDYTHAWGKKTYYTQIRIDPLPPDDADRLLAALLGSDPMLEPLKRLLADRTDGNPFFLEESVRALWETGVLAGERGSYRLARAFSDIHVPPTVQAVLAARIDRLSAEDKHLLQSAAVIGKDVPLTVLQRVTDEADDALRTSLARLQGAEFIHETKLFPEPEYSFKHALTHEVAYGSLLGERRHELHRRIVEAIEALYANRLVEQIEKLAHHASRGELWDKALVYLRQAGARALARSAHREAATYFEQAVAAVERLPQSPTTIRTSIDLRIDIRTSLYPLGGHARIGEHLRVGERLAAEVGDRARVGRMVAFQAHIARSTGEPLQAINLANRALAIAETEHDFGLAALAKFFLGQAYHVQGDYQRAIDVLAPLLERLQGDLTREQLGMGLPASVATRVWLALCLSELGRFAEARARAEEAVRISEAVTHPPYGGVHAWWAAGVVELLKGELASATAALEHCVRLARDGNLVLHANAGEGYLGYAYLLAGRVSEALEMIEAAVAQGEALGFVFRYLHTIGLLAEARLRNGEAQEARRLAIRALERCGRHRLRGYEAYTLRILGEIVLDHGEAEEASSYYAQALDLAHELGMRPLVAHCYFGLGKVYRGSAEREHAQERFTTAVTMYREMDMHFWLKKAEAELTDRAVYDQ